MRPLTEVPGQCRLLIWHLPSLESGFVPCCVTYMGGTFKATHSTAQEKKGGKGALLNYHHLIGINVWFSLYLLHGLTRPSRSWMVACLSGETMPTNFQILLTYRGINL